MSGASGEGCRHLVLIQATEETADLLGEHHHFGVVKVLFVEQDVEAELATEVERGEAAANQKWKVRSGSNQIKQSCSYDFARLTWKGPHFGRRSLRR